MPYFYTLSWEATQKGYPPLRPIFWLDPTDSALWSVDDAFLLGDQLLVYPILEEGQRMRSVELPRGHWYHFWDDQRLEGQATLDAPLEQIPILVKAGTVLPMEEGDSFNLLPQKSTIGKTLVLHLYAPVEGSDATESRLYSDFGDGYGASRLDKFRIQVVMGGLDLTWESEGEFTFPYGSIQVQAHGITLDQAWVDGKQITVHENQVALSAPFCLLYLKEASVPQN
jgi:alpha-glucosidase